ncbi:hypothetical protein HD806DRAFT_518528 [Xylariaceae sp. AK1471]|nr:hypothetical protein HD806DRAFT_518528 [Xylariaceae sp. AK1471]
MPSMPLFHSPHRNHRWRALETPSGECSVGLDVAIRDSCQHLAWLSPSDPSSAQPVRYVMGIVDILYSLDKSTLKVSCETVCYANLVALHFGALYSSVYLTPATIRGMRSFISVHCHLSVDVVTSSGITSGIVKGRGVVNWGFRLVHLEVPGPCAKFDSIAIPTLRDDI